MKDFNEKRPSAEVKANVDFDDIELLGAEDDLGAHHLAGSETPHLSLGYKACGCTSLSSIEGEYEHTSLRI